jgi:predicted permease
MEQILATVLPVFGLIVLGYASVRVGLIRKTAGEGLGQYVFTLGLPALLFRTMVEVKPPEGAPLGLWGTYFGAVIIVWLATVIAARVLRVLPGEDTTAAAMAAGFSNLLMLGLPIIYGHYGPEATLAAALIISIHAPLQWMGATLAMEWQRSAHQVNLGRLFWNLGRDLIRNPIVFGLVAGSLWRISGFGLPGVMHSMITMVADSSVPAALVALGFTLATLPLAGEIGAAALIVALKMLVMPAACFLLGHYVFDLPPLWTAVAVIFGSLPGGANAYLFATRYEAAVAPVSASIAMGTALAAITAPLLLWLLDNFLL